MMRQPTSLLLHLPVFARSPDCHILVSYQMKSLIWYCWIFKDFNNMRCGFSQKWSNFGYLLGIHLVTRQNVTYSTLGQCMSGCHKLHNLPRNSIGHAIHLSKNMKFINIITINHPILIVNILSFILFSPFIWYFRNLSKIWECVR